MKAIAIDGYGDAGELQAREAPDSKPGDEEILIRVRAAGVNPLDWKIRQGQPVEHCWRRNLVARP